MKRSLLTQMRNEWRSNMWMVIQLVIVSVILWFLFIGVWSLVNMSMRFKGYDVSDLYIGDIKALQEGSIGYQPYDDEHSAYTDYTLLMTQIRSNPNVEIATAGINAATYRLNAYNTSINSDSIAYYGNRRVVTPDVIRLYRLESPDGLSTEQLAEVIERGELIISRPDVSDDCDNLRSFIDKDVFVGNDSSVVRHVGALAYGLRRKDYEPQRGVIYTPLPENIVPAQLLIRIRPGRDMEFRESLNTADLRVGNVYISGLAPISSYQKSSQLNDEINMRNYMICASFLMIVIFLGFLGTFWFRTQQRVEEIAVRIVNGATRVDIFRRFIGEGMILLCIATLIAIPIEIMLIHYDLIAVDTYMIINFKSIEIYQSFAFVLVSLGLLIVAGIWFPGRKAMNINPATALKDL